MFTFRRAPTYAPLVRSAFGLLLVASLLAACGLVGLDTAGRWCGWSGTRLAFDGHTTLADADLPHGDIGPDQGGELVVTAEPVPLPGGAPDFSAPPTDPPTARMYCFHPEGSNMVVRGVLPDGWQPPE
jgi:hypothetical protein